MKRREFITTLAATAATIRPLAARAQQQAVPVVGFLSVASPDILVPSLAALREGLKENGYIEGQNVIVEYHYALGQFDRMPVLAAELVARQVDVIIAGGGASVATKAATTTTPVVSLFGGDPVQAGLVASLNRPGNNITGVVLFAYSLGAKRFELLHEAIPTAKLVAVLANPSNPDPGSKSDLREVEASARAVGQQISIVSATNESDFEPAFAAMVQQGTGALLVMADPFFNARRLQLIALAARHAIPAIYEWREIAAAGGLMSYGSSLTDAYRHLGIYTAKILKGAKPADLPIDRAVKIELVLNLKTAKTLGVTFPLTLLGRADEVIE
jgi:putative tryptophan/tyrosine transport system substrate-binding protein